MFLGHNQVSEIEKNRYHIVFGFLRDSSVGNQLSQADSTAYAFCLHADAKSECTDQG